jgi:diguanylate cyclase (GGDEF)-like protein/PAS domain S-box-containing protein
MLDRSSRWQLRATGLPLALAAAYLLTFPFLYDLVGVTAAIGTVAPVAALGWAFGPRWGAIAGVLSVPLTAAAFAQVGIGYDEEPLRSGVIPGTLGWVAVGYFVGSGRALARRLALQKAMLERALSERTAAEGRLRAERDRYEMLLDTQSALGEGVALGRGERIEWANGALLTATGHTLESLRAVESIFDLVAPDERAGLRAAIAARRARHLARIVRADGSVFPAELAVRSLRREDGSPGFVLVARDITERAEAERMLRRHAEEDALTGLATRGHFETRLATLLAPAGAQVAVLLIDLDGFKAVNDRYGHAAGDAVLRIVGRRILGQIRDSDLAGRLGGDEFVVAAPGATAQNIAPLAARIGRAIERPLRVDDVGVTVGASIGIAAAPSDGTTAAELLRAADGAMYAAKRVRVARVG